MAYQGAPEPVRAALRQAMTEAGDLDLARVVAGRREDSGHGVPASAAERGYLAAELTRRRDWPGLWRLSLGFPLAEASTAVRRLPPGWRPADEAGRQLLARLAAAGPPELTAAAAPPATRITAGGSGPLIGCSFAPDGTEVAVTRWYDRPAALPRYRRFTTLYALPGGRRRHRFPDAGPVLHLGRAVVAYVSAYDAGAARVRRYTPEHGREDLLIQARACSGRS